MPLKAAPDDQALLLDLQSLDTKLQQLAHKASTLPELVTIAAISTEAEVVRLQLSADRGAREDAGAELGRIESDVALVESRIARDEQRLHASSNVKDVAGLDAELASLRKRQDDLEEIQLTVMERVDELEIAERSTMDRHNVLLTQLAAMEADRDAALTALNGQRTTASAQRSTIASKLPADLLALYERQRERYGAGASLLQGGVSKASGVKLTESDMAAIRAASADDVVLCPDSSAILVRTSESGL